jgi:hypothetical protein
MRHSTYTKLTANQLHNLLEKRKIPEPLKTNIKESVAIRKKQIHKQRVEDRVRAKRWGLFIRPLSNHINTIKSNLRYHTTANPELHAVLKDYLEILNDTRNELNKLRIQREATPINYAKQNKKDIRDWTDMVNVGIKARHDATLRQHTVIQVQIQQNKSTTISTTKQTTQAT